MVSVIHFPLSLSFAGAMETQPLLPIVVVAEGTVG
jgi:hypothetical protein